MELETLFDNRHRKNFDNELEYNSFKEKSKITGYYYCKPISESDWSNVEIVFDMNLENIISVQYRL